MELKIQNITKRYRDKTAVDDVSITLTPGVWGLLGANGAGKTTLMRMLAGILRPSSGRILCDGVEIGTLGAAYREKTGVSAAGIRVLPGIHGAGLSGIYGGAQGSAAHRGCPAESTHCWSG